ncbi:E3 ubiquitin-protein ligase TRIM71-like [Gigantopelta aegis]|uniref:E3 ubiquitin-protein ligase TRIM71-like n=1 Tax=Gigantopelta aegis TaxID=1735272 RepID=UPI001B88905B|nr:E3 ubiquitin-protein ligase TRIM71-like [Gigantopelta aegis]
MSRDKLTELIPSFTHTCQDHSDQQLKYYCQQCIIPVCIECTIINHKDHPVTENMSRDELTKLIPSYTHTCQDHTDQQLKYYCQQCIIPVCSECTIINHKDHSVTEVSKQVDINKATVHESIQGFQVAQQQLKKVLISGEEIKEKINARKNEIDTIIRQTFSTLQHLYMNVRSLC